MALKLINPGDLSEQERSMVDREIYFASDMNLDEVWVGFGRIYRQHNGWVFNRDSRFSCSPELYKT